MTYLPLAKRWRDVEAKLEDVTEEKILANTKVKDVDPTPVTNVLFKVIDGVLCLRDSGDLADQQIAYESLPNTVKTANWSNVTATRAIGTVYQNTTGKHLLVIVWVSIGTGTVCGVRVSVSPDNVTYTAIADNNSDYASGEASVSVVVPPNYYYKTATGPGNTLKAWIEVEI